MTNQVPSLNRIAVGIDGSKQSLAALSWATTFAAECDAEVSAIMSWNYPTSLLLPVVGAPVLPAESMTASTEALLEETIRDHPGAASITEMHTPMGSARNVLVEASEDHDLVVIGRTGRGAIERLVLGSTASYVARHGRCAVALVDTADVPGTIVVAVDGSKHSIEALAWTLRVAGDRDVVAVYSHDESILDEMALSSPDREPLDDRAEAALDNAIADAAALAECDPTRVRGEVRSGDPRTSIVDAASADSLLVMGARGHSGLSAWVLGSLADYALHHSAAPLVIWNSA